MSTPTVAGIAGLIRQYFIDGFYPSGSRNAIDTMNPMGALVKALFAHSGQQINTIVRVSPVTGATNQATINSDYPNNVAGYGRVQIDTILNFGSVSTNNPLSLYVIGDYDKMDMHKCNGTSTKRYYFKTAGTGNVRVTFAYTDKGSSAIGDLVNDIDFKIKKCTSFSGNDINANTFQCTATDTALVPPALSTKPIQMINILSPTDESIYVVELSCPPIATYDQPYALVMTQSITKFPDLPENNPFKPFTTAGAAATAYVSEGAAVIIAVFAVLTIVLIVLVIIIYFAHKRADKREEDEVTAAINNLARQHRQAQQQNQRGM
jgi:hypothetical protein